MDSLPPPSETVDDEWASMRIRFQKEGLQWDKLSSDDRILQVWRWMVDSETNLRTVRIKTEKHANLRNNEREELEDQIAKCAKQTLDLEHENKSLHFENTQLHKELDMLKNKLPESDNGKLSASPDSECVFKLEESLTHLEKRLEEMSCKYERSKAKLKLKSDLRILDLETQVENLQTELSQAANENESLKLRLEADSEHCQSVEAQIQKIYEERVEMAKKCVAKEDEMTNIRRMFEECEQRNSLLEERNRKLLEETLKLKDIVQE